MKEKEGEGKSEERIGETESKKDIRPET